MGRALSLTAIRTLVLIILTTSAALLYDYTQPVSAFCESGAGCDAVRTSSFATIFGVPQPALGLIAYMIVFGVTLMRHEARRKYLLPLTLVGARSGLASLRFRPSF